MVSKGLYCFLTWLVNLVSACLLHTNSFKAPLIRSDAFRLLVQFIRLSYLTNCTSANYFHGLNVYVTLFLLIAAHLQEDFHFLFSPFHSFSASTAGYSRCSSDSGGFVSFLVFCSSNLCQILF
uniref:Secreted protein n=1 Tax=Anopheles aquasalis TaxID=42839 RepID=T1E8I9_ANOAQ